VDLHRHLEGSLRFETVQELAHTHGLNVTSTAQLRSMVQVQENEPVTFENFLSKFATLRLLYRSPEIISRITQEAIADAAADNVRYLELRFTPVALGRLRGFPLAQVMDWVIEAATRARARREDTADRQRQPPQASILPPVSLLAAERRIEHRRARPGWSEPGFR
jgi:adenosine deaminase